MAAVHSTPERAEGKSCLHFMNLTSLCQWLNQTTTQTRRDVIARTQHAFKVAWPSRTPDDYGALSFFARRTNKHEQRKQRGLSNIESPVNLLKMPDEQGSEHASPPWVQFVCNNLRFDSGRAISAANNSLENIINQMQHANHRFVHM
jgi:hypothetical protein